MFAVYHGQSTVSKCFRNSGDTLGMFNSPGLVERVRLQYDAKLYAAYSTTDEEKYEDWMMISMKQCTK